jgi:hypothetical protein
MPLNAVKSRGDYESLVLPKLLEKKIGVVAMKVLGGIGKRAQAIARLAPRQRAPAGVQQTGLSPGLRRFHVPWQNGCPESMSRNISGETRSPSIAGSLAAAPPRSCHESPPRRHRATILRVGREPRARRRNATGASVG